MYSTLCSVFLKFWGFSFKFLNLFRKDRNPLCGATDSPVWTSGNVCLGFQSQCDSLVCMLYHLCAMDSSDSPDDLLTASMVAKPLRSTYLHIYLISIGGA